MKAKDLSRHSARLDHMRNKIHRAKRELRDQPAELRDSLELAIVQLRFATQTLDRLAGEQARKELRG